MASPGPLGASRSPRSPAADNNGAGDDLAQSIKHLSLSTSTPSKQLSRSPSRSNLSPTPFKPAVNRSPSTPRPASAMRLTRDALNGSPSSRSATPTLLRKASMNSLHSANGIGGASPRRAASVCGVNPRSPFRSTSPEPERPPPPTAAQIANAHFRKELDSLHGSTAANQTPAETVVILQDSCYGHRYSRPRTSRSALNTIVERPERMKASALGVSAAYVRLGERHQDGAHPPEPGLDPNALPAAPFRIQKTIRRLALSSQAVTNVHGTKWMEELKIMCDSAESKLAMNGKELQRPNIDRGPNSGAPKDFHEGDLYLCAESLDALEGSLGGLCEAIDLVFSSEGPKQAFVAIRPPGHHCSASYPSGFCWLNNVHVGIMHAILSHGLTHAAIIDFDLHHGDGSQAIAWDHNSRSVGMAKNAALWKKTSIGYFSLHDINSYPCEQGDMDKIKNASLCIENAHGQTVWNVHLQPWKNLAEFWALYESKYSILLEKARAYLRAQTERLRGSGLNSKAAIFISAGFDASEWEGEGMQRHNVNVPTEFYARLTRDLVRIAAEEGTSVEGRIISVLEGGYSDRALYSGILSHLSGLAGDDPVVTKEQDYNGLGFEMRRRIGSVGSVHGRKDSLGGSLHGRKDSSASERGSRPYESSWWSPEELDCLDETLVPPKPDPKPPRTGPQPTYSSPTQSSQAKVSVAPRGRRTASGMSNGGIGFPMSRAPTPPPPDVPWNIAAHELSKLLIPIDRQTESCKHEDLNAEATKARRDRQTVLAQSVTLGEDAPSGPTERVPTRMALRERKAKPGLYAEEEDDYKSRRKTVAGVLATDKPASRGAGRSRRLSAASTVVPGAVDDEVSPLPPLSATANGSARPDTSMSVRPESSMSVRTAITTNGAGLAVKKTRAPTKKDPVPRAPRAPKKTTAGTTGASNSAVAVNVKAETFTAGSSVVTKKTSNSSSSAEKGTDAVDKLTSDMKKVKITLVTKSMREARERDRVSKEAAEKAAEKVASSSATTPLNENNELPGQDLPQQPTPLIAAPVDPLPGAATPMDSSIQLPPHGGTAEVLAPEVHSGEENRPFSASASPTMALGQATTPELVVSPAIEDPFHIPLPASSPVYASPTRDLQGSDVFIPYHPESVTAAPVEQPPQLPPQQPLQWLPPNTTTTPAPMRRADLPVFTSTSAIPFAVKAKVKTEQESRQAESVWEIPETPQK